MNRPLSDQQEAALCSLWRGWRYGISRTVEISLEKRRLIKMTLFATADGNRIWLPDLTPAGRDIAARLIADQLIAAGARTTRAGFLVIDGGA